MKIYCTFKTYTFCTIARFTKKQNKFAFNTDSFDKYWKFLSINFI